MYQQYRKDQNNWVSQKYVVKQHLKNTIIIMNHILNYYDLLFII